MARGLEMARAILPLQAPICSRCCNGLVNTPPIWDDQRLNGSGQEMLCHQMMLDQMVQFMLQ
jgi:hypothetical protein